MWRIFDRVTDEIAQDHRQQDGVAADDFWGVLDVQDQRLVGCGVAQFRAQMGQHFPQWKAAHHRYDGPLLEAIDINQRRQNLVHASYGFFQQIEVGGKFSVFERSAQYGLQTPDRLQWLPQI